MKTPIPALAPALISVMHDDNVEVRRYAANSLGSIGPDAEAGIPVLMEALHDVDREVRRYAIWSLGKIGLAARAAVPLLVEILKDCLAHNYDPIDNFVAAYNTLTKLDPQARDEVMKQK